MNDFLNSSYPWYSKGFECTCGEKFYKLGSAKNPVSVKLSRMWIFVQGVWKDQVSPIQTQLATYDVVEVNLFISYGRNITLYRNGNIHSIWT